MAHEGAFLAKRDDWLKYHAKHPEVFEMIAALAATAKEKGITRVSIWLLAGQLRWTLLLQRKKLKVGNDHLAFYARHWMTLDPSRRGAFFPIRRAVGEDFQLTKRECGIK